MWRGDGCGLGDGARGSIGEGVRQWRRRKGPEGCILRAVTLVERAERGVRGVQLLRLLLVLGLPAGRVRLLALRRLTRFIVAEMANIALDTSSTWPLLIAGPQQGRIVSACTRRPKTGGPDLRDRMSCAVGGEIGAMVSMSCTGLVRQSRGRE